METPEKRNLFLHIGFPKCASTAFQFWAFHNADVLESAGFFYPRVEDFYHHSFAISRNASNQTRGYFYYEPGQDYGIFEQALASKTPHVIISTENFTWYPYSYNATELKKELSAHFDTFIVVYFREQIRFINSAYCEQVQGFENQSSAFMDEFLAKDFNWKFADLGSIMMQWYYNFGPGYIKHGIFDPSSFYRNDFISDMLKTIGFAPYAIVDLRPLKGRHDGFVLKLKSKLWHIRKKLPRKAKNFDADQARWNNVTLSLEALETVRLCNEEIRFTDWGAHATHISNVQELCKNVFGAKQRSSFLLTPDQCRTIRQRYQEGNEKLAGLLGDPRIASFNSSEPKRIDDAELDSLRERIRADVLPMVMESLTALKKQGLVKEAQPQAISDHSSL